MTNRVPMRRLLAFLTALAALVLAAVPSPVRALGLGDTFDTVSSTSVGYFGCLQGIDDRFFYSCVVAYQVPAGVRVVVYESDHVKGQPVDPSYLEDVTVPAGALTVGSWTLGPTVHLVADLPRTGYIDLTSKAHRYWPTVGNKNCGSLDEMRYEMRVDDNSTLAGGYETWDTGTVSGYRIASLDGCNAYVTAPASGFFVFTTVTTT